MKKHLYAPLTAILMSCCSALAHDISGTDHVVPDVIQEDGEIGGDFSLIDQDGNTVTRSDLIGNPTAVFFGYTMCPDVCPTTLYELSELRKKLGPNGDELRVVFITLDPENDTPEVLKDYVSYFDPSFRAFTGTQEQVDAAADAYFIIHDRVPQDGGGYTVSHTASVYLMDRDNRFVDTITYQEDSLSALRKLSALVQE